MEAVDERFLPVPGNVLPRFAGIPTFMRLPHRAAAELDDVDIALIGVPFDSATSNRPGARHGPRQLRDLSTMIRLVNQATRVAPFHLARCADLGDVLINPVSLDDSRRRIVAYYRDIAAAGVVPLTAGGDHFISWPILEALAADGPLGMIHVDAHSDLYPPYFGGFDSHGTPFRRAVEQGLLDPRRIVQIGLRGSSIDMSDVDFADEHGIRQIAVEEVFDRGVDDVMDEARRLVGKEPIYVSFDIDAIDPSQAPGTGTPEVGGLWVQQAQRLIRRLTGLEVVGADLVEVSPPWDAGGNTAWVGANLMFELLCVLADGVHRRRP
ncbi:MAG: agmatinase [Alphaproteobacteria bacterium]|jgi:guanidinopropionase|nr:agmatinase [Alphaproteobacteria bacterium]